MTETCWRCRQPILPDEPRYTGEPERYQHYECYERAHRELDEALARGPELVKRAQALLTEVRRILKK